jgi:hypothetical protein
MALMLTTNAQMVATVLRENSVTEGQSLMAAIAATRTLALLVDDSLRALVHQARARGATWNEIGEVLHVTRQAAFQRFGGQLTTQSPEEQTMNQPIPEAGAKAIKVIESFLAEDWEGLRATFDERMTQAAPVEFLKSALVSGLETYGAFIAMGTPVSSVIGDYTVVDVPMAVEKGDLTGRVSFNADGEVAGLFFLPADQTTHKGEGGKDES